MASWRRKALELFPSKAGELRRGEGIHVVLANLMGDLQQAYREDDPDREFINRVYEFAAWCFGPRQNESLRNAAAVSFYEHLPTFRPARADLARRFTPDMWAELQPLLHQMLPPASYDAFEAEIRALGLDRANASVRRAT